MTVLALAAGLLLIGAGGRAAGSDLPALDTLILQNMAGNHVAGVSACVAWQGEIIWDGHYGYADVAGDIAVTDSTLFMLASVSKTVTGSALMQLWEDGRFDLDDPIDSHLPFLVRSPWFPDVPITFRMLLTHTSGIHDDRDLFDQVTVPGDSPVGLGDFLRDYLVPGGAYYDVHNYDPWAPGDGYEYSNIGVTLAGYLVETISQSDFSDYCRQQIFDPLGMQDASWFLAPLDTTRVARPYHWDGQEYVPFTHYGYPFYPAGQLRTTAKDLARFLSVFTEGGEGILQPTTADLMMTVSEPPDQGLIWFRTELGGHEAWFHTGGHNGVSTYVVVVPSQRTSCVVLTNGEATTLILQILIWNHVLSHPADVETDTMASGPRLFLDGPNPFGASTTIRCDLPREGPTVLRVYDTAGRAVTTFLDGVVGPGSYSFVVDGDGLAAGTYLIALQSERYSRSRKIVLVR